jgi:outer membrane protein TolC
MDKFMNAARKATESTALMSGLFKIGILLICSFTLTWLSGCSHHRGQSLRFKTAECTVPCQSLLQQIDYAALKQNCIETPHDLVGQTPLTISTFHEQKSWELTLEECVELTLAHSDVLQKLGGIVVDNPGFVNTLYDQALVESRVGSVEDALSAFDAQWAGGISLARNQRRFNNPIFGGGVNSAITNLGNYNASLVKQTANGTTFAVRNFIDYTRNNLPIATPQNPFGNRFGSVWDVVNRIEIRQPLLRGRGAAVNRIAGPNPMVGVYNGVLIARIRSDISLTDFEIAVRNLIRDVERNYWELYFAYQDLDTKLTARNSARETWENRKLRLESGVGRPDEEAQARQQYYSFQNQAQNALTGTPLMGQLGLLGAERNLRRLMGQISSDGTLIKPISEPAVAPICFDWASSHAQALEHRPELRRQRWVVKQRELELFAARSLNQWQFDFVGQHDNRGWGDQLMGNAGAPDGSALGGLLSGDLNEWRVGFEVGGAIGNRRGHLAVRNAELNLVRDRSLLGEQQRQITLDLNAAYTEVDRAMEVLKTSFNSLIAVQEELNPKRKRVQEGQDQVFFLLDAEQRAASAESAVHRAVVDYNLALMNFSFLSGELMTRYNVMLTEGPWSPDAQRRAIEKASRYLHGGPPREYDVEPVSAGPYSQQVPSSAVPYGEPNQPKKDLTNPRHPGELLPQGERHRPDLPPVISPPQSELLIPEFGKKSKTNSSQTLADG